MSERSITGRIRKFYESYQFPGNRPIDRDGLILFRRFKRSIECRQREDRLGGLRVLDAGCGTGNTSVALARCYPTVRFLGIDQSDASLKRARSTARLLGLNNLRFRNQDLMKPLIREKCFDVVLCLGVLHHTADMKKVLNNLRRVLKGDGELYLWVYGKHGRYRHSLNMRLLKMLCSGKEREIDPVTAARTLIHHTRDNGVIKDLLGNIRVGALEKLAFEDPVWIADQFLNPHETPIEIKQLIRLVSGSGLTMEHVVGLDVAGSKKLLPDVLVERIQQLSPQRRLVALDLLMKPERYFVILRNADSGQDS